MAVVLISDDLMTPEVVPLTVTVPAVGATVRQRLGLMVLLVGTALVYVWGITVNGTGNAFYAAAVWSGSKSWKALLFGSLDPANFITVDKPPVSQWVMGLSVRLFGFNSVAELVPEALMGVATVALVFAALARLVGRNTGLLAGICLALTPVAAMMFRFNKPDAVMVLLMTAAVYATVRALPRASTMWIVLAGTATGFAFLAKMLEGLMVVPAIGLVYLVAAPNPLRARVLQLCGALAAMVVASGWYVLLTILWPASTRPYLAGSTDNSFMNLVLGYNGFARLLGHRPPAEAVGHQPFADGPARLFTGEFGFEISWLLPAALLSIALVLVARWATPRTDPVRAVVLLFGSWMIIDGGVLSSMSGLVIPYYSLSIAPAAAALTAIGTHEMWRTRATRFGRTSLAAIVLVSGVWGFWLLHRNGSWLPGLRWTLLVVSVLAAAMLLWTTHSRRWAMIALAVGMVAMLGGSAAYTAATLGQPHQVRLVAGPKVWSNGMVSPASNQRLVAMLAATRTTWSAAVDRSQPAAELELASRTPVMAIGGFGGKDPVPTLQGFLDEVRRHQVTYYVATGDDHRGGPHADIRKWVVAHFTPIQLGLVTAYDLSTYHD